MSKYAGNGQYTIERVSLLYNDSGSNEKEIDLSVAFVQVDLYESIFNQTMSGQVSITDTFNLQDLLPLYGNERVEIAYHTQGNEANPVSYTGVVYKISEKHRISEHASGYTIYFVSEEMINSQAINTQRGYQETPSKIVEKIYQRIVGRSEKLLETVQSKSVDVYTLGTVKPLQAISMLAKHAYSKNDEHGYLFYEDNLQFNFKPLQYLYTQEPVKEYKSRNKGMYDDPDQRVQESFNTIQDLKLMEENSYLDRMMEGQHGTSFNRFDLFSKRISVFEYDKEKFYDDQKSLGSVAHKKELDVSYQNRNTLRYGNNSNILLQGISKNVMSKIEASTIRVEITVFGDSFIRCGQTVVANLPIWNQDQQEVTDMISGKFLISEIHHQLNNEEKYMQTIMLQKEAYETL